MALLEIENLEVNYGMIKALKGVSFEVNKGEIIALIGAFRYFTFYIRQNYI